MSWLLLSVLTVTSLSAITDARSGRIPNLLTVPLVALAPLAQLASAGPGGLATSLAGAALCTLTPLVLFLRNAMGGGDLKLFCGIGAALGPSLGLELQLTAFLVAAAVAVIVLCRRGSARETLRRAIGKAPTTDVDVSDGIRLGVPIFVAALWCIGPKMAGP